MKGCGPCKEALEDLKDLALEKGSLDIVLKDATAPESEKFGIVAAPSTCVVPAGREADLNLDCVIGYSKHYFGVRRSNAL